MGFNYHTALVYAAGGSESDLLSKFSFDPFTGEVLLVTWFAGAVVASGTVTSAGRRVWDGFGSHWTLFGPRELFYSLPATPGGYVGLP